MRSELYQIVLIAAGVVATALFGVFFYREMFPEYRIYQNDYLELEKFRSTYTGQPQPPFKEGVAQIVLEREDRGPPVVDRCTSCHVALQLEHFSPTKIGKDINGQLLLDENGLPVKVPNEEYVFAKLDEKISDLKKTGYVSEAEKLAALKVAKVGDQTYDVTKVLAMHPLIGRETRPFEFHSIEEYGCTVCHSGNGRALTTSKAHGPVFDGTYQVEYEGPVPEFVERDRANDPKFASAYNNKPGPELLFQTTPILVGSLIEARCMDCHQATDAKLHGAIRSADLVRSEYEHKVKAIQKAFNQAQQELLSIIELQRAIEKEGVAKTVSNLRHQFQDYTLPFEQREEIGANLKHVLVVVGGEEGLRPENAQTAKDVVMSDLNQQLKMLLGSDSLVSQLQTVVNSTKENLSSTIATFLIDHQKDKEATGMLFAKMNSLQLQQAVLAHVEETKASFEQTVGNQQDISTIQTDIDLLTKDYHNGKEFYISQACYACHRIAGFSRGGVGPELTNEGNSYLWFVKKKLEWPQGDLKTSTMPNYKMDQKTIEDLMTFLMSQRGATNAVSEQSYKVAIQEWEAGRKMAWEKPVTPAQMYDLNFSMTVFATEGCAACHRLEGFKSNVGFRSEEESKENWDAVYNDRQWFRDLVPETITGSQIVQVLDQQGAAIDQHIVDNVRQNSILDEIDAKYPGIIESFYTNFIYASRAKNSYYAQLADKETDPKKKQTILEELEAWKSRVHRLLMIYIQEYGLGRLIGPRPNWSGIYRSDEWLMEHFRNPSAHTPKSIMPVFPFDDTKFYALTFMLDHLAKKNRDALREVWEHKGFDPGQAYQAFCSQCHGEYRGGNGPISEWIYPIPKNLRNADFLRNLTKERVIFSITHGVKGTPMPPWGEVAPNKIGLDPIPVMNKQEIRQLADWLFANLPGGSVGQPGEVPKWEYTPEDVLRELKQEGNILHPGKQPALPVELDSNEKQKNVNSIAPELAALPDGREYYAAIIPFPPKKEKLDVDVVFDVIPDPTGYPDKYSYYIKKKYYTEENIHQGKVFFETNCAVCHGKEGDGTGVRAGYMQEAKPRNLTNLDWLQTRDDLRLLRSIKYGVPGTAMTPWGDLTSSLQRMQLVIFIRSLSDQPLQREKLMQALYKTFDEARLVVENARVSEFKMSAKLENEADVLTKQQTRIATKVEETGVPSKEAIEIYQKRLTLLAQLAKEQEIDQILVDLKNQIDKEKMLYQNLGVTLLTLKIDDGILHKYVDLIALDDGRFKIDNDVLHYQQDPAQEEKMEQLGKEIEASIKQYLNKQEAAKTIIEGKIPSAQRTNDLTELNAEIGAVTRLHNSFVSDLQEAIRIRKKETELVTLYQEKLNKVRLQKKEGRNLPQPELKS